MSAKYLVTGGAGFIGSNVVHRLLELGESVRVFDNFSTGREENLADVRDDIDVVVGDLRDADAVSQVVQGINHVIHIGALPSVIRSVEDPMASNEVNITGTLSLLLSARDAGVESLVLSSSSSVYGDTPVLPKQEDMKPMPLSPYAINKLCDEHYCRVFFELYGLKTYALRYFNVFGPRQDPKSHYAAVIPLFVGAYAKGVGPTIHGDGEQTRDFTFVENVVNANILCCSASESAAGSVYNIACGDRTSVNELALRIGELMGSDEQLNHVDPRAGDVRDSQADNTRAREILGWEPTVGFEEGLATTVAWFREHGV